MQKRKCFKVAGFLLVLVHLISFTLYGQANTEFYCYSNGDLFILPLGVTYDCTTAKCMFNYYFKSNGREIDNNRVYCGQVVTTNTSYVELISPFCPGQTSNSSEKVEIFKDDNFSNGDAHGEGIMRYSAGQSVPCMDLTPRKTSGFIPNVEQIIIHGGNGGDPVRNDEITSIRVPPGLKITCWIDCNYSGASRVFTEDCANVGPDWNDRISSFKVESNVVTTIKSVKVINNGNQSGDETIIYPPGGPLNFDAR